MEYVKCGDCYTPNLHPQPETRPIGRWGRMHREFLREYHPSRYNELVLSGKLQGYLADLNEDATQRMDLIMLQMKEAEGVTEDLKRKDMMAWVGAMSSIYARAEEIILAELIYC